MGLLCLSRRNQEERYVLFRMAAACLQAPLLAAGSGLSASALLPSPASTGAAASTCRADPWHPHHCLLWHMLNSLHGSLLFIFTVFVGGDFFLFRILFCLLSLHVGFPCFSRCRILKYELKKLCKCCCEAPETSLEDLSCRILL